MKQIAQWKQVVNGLRRAAHPDVQLTGLKHCCELPLSDPAHLKTYHDTLLYLCAYPFNRQVFDLAEKELHRVADVLKLKQQYFRWQFAMNGSGLPYTEHHCQYSAGMLKWLLEKFGGDVQPLAATNSNEITKLLWQAMLPGIEFFDSTQGKPDLWSRVRKLSGHKQGEAALHWILQLFKQQLWNPVLKELLFDGLGIFINWKLNDPLFTRSFLRCPIHAVHYRKMKQKKLNSSSIVGEPLAKPLLLKEKERFTLIDLTRASLALYYRETDPVTFADPAETSLYDMGNGLQIALTGMQKEWKLTLESYIGFMAFKNGVPMAYGGGWIFGHRCKIGVNIYPPFRGAESDRLFCQVMRLYYQLFQARHFIVKPYQFGKGNPEGLRSAAFWFYYKLGFRPQHPAIKQTAFEEWMKITRNKLYRTPVSVLKSFTRCNMQYEPVKTGAGNFDADEISNAITTMVCSRFSGNREIAIAVCLEELIRFLETDKIQQMDPVKQKAWHNWGLLFAVLPQTGGWSKMQRKKFLQILQLKISGSERAYIIALQKHKSFWQSVRNLFANPVDGK